MAPGKHNDGSSTNIAGNDVSSSTTFPTMESTTIPATGFTTTTASGITTTTSMQSPSPTALFNTAVVTTSAPAGLSNAAPSSAPTNSGQSNTSVKIIGGIVAALIGILLIFAVAIFYLKRRWKAKEQEESARRAAHAARVARDEEEGGGEGTAFIGDKKEHVREDSMSSSRSKGSADDYLKSGRKRSSLGTFYSPGIAAEEAYMMFGGSAADLNEDEEKKPLTYHERHLSESMAASKRNSWGSIPETNDPRSRRISLLDDGSRYPGVDASTDSLGRRGMRHSVSYPPGIVDPFSDATPTTSPKAPSRAFTTGDVTAPGAKPAGAKPAGPPAGSPPGTQSPGRQGRRVSLQGGVGVRRATAPGSPGGSPVGSPRTAWK